MVFSLGTAAFAAAPLSAVRSLQAYAIDDDEINLKWKAVQGADGYGVFMYDGVKWRGIGSTRKTSFEADDLQSAKQYKFRVRAYTLNGSLTNDSWNQIFVIYNGNTTDVEINLPEGTWTAACYDTKIDVNGLGKFTEKIKKS